MNSEEMLALAGRKQAKADVMWADWAMADPRRMKRWKRMTYEASRLRARAQSPEQLKGEGR